MFIVSTVYKTFIDALFPVSEAEVELFSLLSEQAYEKLPSAPAFTGLAISAKDSENMKSIFAYKDERVAKLIWNIKYKKSAQAVKIGGYALWRGLVGAGVEREFVGHFGLSEGEGELAASRARDDGVSKQTLLSTPAPIINSATTLIIPMPITNRRRKERGYNQCELLIDEIARLDTNKKFQIEKNLLTRTHHTSRQTLKDRSSRVESVKGIFAVDEEIIKTFNKGTIQQLNNSAQIRPAKIIIIDDVITTGSTMYEAIETMKKAGFNNVHGLSLAH